MELSSTQRQNLQQEERELERAITGLAQRVKAVNESERRQMDAWQKRLVVVRTQLGYILSASGRLLSPPEENESRYKAAHPKATPPTAMADPKAVFDMGKNMGAGAALRIDTSL